MKKYRIIVNPPKAKRMKGSGQVVVSISDGTVVGAKKVFPVGELNQFEFEMPDDVPWIYNKVTLGGSYFDIELVYSNKEKTREEVIRPVPEECDAKTS